jgi:hypothetical protein
MLTSFWKKKGLPNRSPFSFQPGEDKRALLFSRDNECHLPAGSPQRTGVHDFPLDLSVELF